MQQELIVPFPPSLNNAFSQNRRTGRRFKTRRYSQWQAQAMWLIKLNKLRRVEGPARITVTLHAKDRRHRDADNLLKPIIDSLVRGGVLAGDDERYVREVSARWGAPDSINPRASVCVESVS